MTGAVTEASLLTAMIRLAPSARVGFDQVRREGEHNDRKKQSDECVKELSDAAPNHQVDSGGDR